MAYLCDCVRQRGQCILFSVVFTSTTPAATVVFELKPGISLLLTNTDRLCGLFYPYDRKGFVGTKKTRQSNQGLVVFNPLWWTLCKESIFLFYDGLECVGHSFAYVAHFLFLGDVWI
jgi:hypothetical protein